MSNKWKWAIGASLSLGLAPFTPEPHIVGKLRWVAGGGVGMELIDYLDLLLHGAPWMFLLILTGFEIGKRLKKN